MKTWNTLCSIVINRYIILLENINQSKAEGLGPRVSNADAFLNAFAKALRLGAQLGRVPLRVKLSGECREDGHKSPEC